MAHVQYIVRQGTRGDCNGNQLPAFWVIRQMVNDDGVIYDDTAWTWAYKSKAAAERKARELNARK